LLRQLQIVRLVDSADVRRTIVADRVATVVDYLGLRVRLVSRTDSALDSSWLRIKLQSVAEGARHVEI
jgi:hypothetical protein